MTWVRLDDATPDHPKYQQLGSYSPLALALQVRALCHANRYLTDGYISPGLAAKLTVDFPQLLDGEAAAIDWPQVLVDAGIWDVSTTGRGWQIHDFHDYQPTKAKVEAERRSTRDRVAQHRARREGPDSQPEHIGNAVSNALLTPLQTPPERSTLNCNAVTGSTDVTAPRPVPSRPVPVLRIPGPGRRNGPVTPLQRNAVTPPLQETDPQTPTTPTPPQGAKLDSKKLRAIADEQAQADTPPTRPAVPW